MTTRTFYDRYLPMPGFRESFAWFKHLVVVDCAAGCRYCARIQLKTEGKAQRKAQKLNALERLCLEAMLELGAPAEAVAVVTRVQRRLGKWRLPQIYRCFDRLERRRMACSLVAPQKTDPVSGAKRLFRVEPAGLGALGKGVPAESFDNQNAQTLAEILRSRDSLATKEILFIGIGICFEAACAHRQGIIHGGILPKNILVTPGLEVKLINAEGGADGDPAADIEQIRGVLHQMTLYASKPEDLKWIAESLSAAPVLPSAEDIQYGLQHRVESTYSPPPSLEWLEDTLSWCFIIVFGVLYWYMTHPADIPFHVQNSLLYWFGQ
jgi:hypothetical protein